MINFLKQLFAPKSPEKIGYLCICCIFKDENSYLQEWMNYHLKIGVEHFYIYDNGSKIAVSETLAQLGLLQYATIIHIEGKTMQVIAYGECIKQFGALWQWMAFIDIDEFIVPKQTHGNLPLLLKDYEKYGGLGINWLIFGSSGHLKRTGKSQLQSFQKRADESFSVNQHIKSIVQPRFIKSSQNAHYFNYIKGKFCVNENFKKIKGPFSPPSVQKIQLNHYYCRSLEEYEEKIARGIADNLRERRIDEFYHHDVNNVTDTEIVDILASLGPKNEH